MSRVDDEYQNAKFVLKLLGDQGEFSMQSSTQAVLTKGLVVAASTLFENRIRQAMIAAYRSQLGGAEHLATFVQNAVFERGYSRLFSWESAKPTGFYGYFGDAFKKRMQDRTKLSPSLDDGSRAFMELGGARNSVVHEDDLGKTLDEVFVLYTRAFEFVQCLCAEIHTFGSAAV